MALFITQCPYCQTTFRTSVSQLESAQGMVRCGACLKVFVADDNLLPSADLQTLTRRPPEEPEDTLEPAPTAEPEIEIEIEIEIEQDHSDILEVEEEPSFTETGTHWEILAVAEVEPDIAAPVEPSEEGPVAPQESAPPPPAPVQSFSALDNDFIMSQDSLASDDGPALSRESLERIADARDSLELDWQDRAGHKPRSAWWTVAAVLLVAGLSAQFLVFQWTALAQNSALRPWLQRICTTLPCSLAPMSDIRSLRSDNLVVRSHTEIANALNVTLVFRNDSAFDQALPALNLHFMNADNEVIAARQFSPEEYLPTALAGIDVLPAGAPVQVSFDIVDPGIEAINYEVSFSTLQSR